MQTDLVASQCPHPRGMLPIWAGDLCRPYCLNKFVNLVVEIRTAEKQKVIIKTKIKVIMIINFCLFVFVIPTVWLNYFKADPHFGWILANQKTRRLTNELCALSPCVFSRHCNKLPQVQHLNIIHLLSYSSVGQKPHGSHRGKIWVSEGLRLLLEARGRIFFPTFTVPTFLGYGPILKASSVASPCAFLLWSRLHLPLLSRLPLPTLKMLVTTWGPSGKSKVIFLF